MARTRSAAAHQKVHDAAIDLVASRGVDATSMDAIAQKSGVSKATIYKHWADKDALLLEMLAHVNGIHSRPVFDSGDTWADMIGVLSYTPKEYAEIRQRIMPHLIAYSASHAGFGTTWKTMVLEPPRRELKHLMKRGAAKGELSPKINQELGLALLIGPMIYSRVFVPDSSKNTRQLAKRVVDAFRRAFELTGEA